MFAIDGPMAEWEKALYTEMVIRNPIAGQEPHTSNSPCYIDAGL